MMKIEDNDWIITVLDQQNAHVCYFVFNMCDYRKSISGSSFWGLRKNPRYKTNKWRYIRTFAFDWNNRFIDSTKSFARLADLYEFYEIIGWDRKYKRYNFEPKFT